MEITTRTVGRCRVLDLRGKLTLGSATATLQKAVQKAVQDGVSKVGLNLEEVSDLDAYGLGEMIACHDYSLTHGSNFFFLNPSDKIRNMAIEAKLLWVFEFFDDEQKALEGCE